MRHAKKTLKSLRSADELVEKLLGISQFKSICLLDSCGVSHLGSHLLIAGIDPLETLEINGESPDKTLEFLDRKLESHFGFFTISYDFGLKLENIKPTAKQFTHNEPDVFLAIFDCLIIHDYETRETFLFGNENRFSQLERRLTLNENRFIPQSIVNSDKTKVRSNFTRRQYLEKIEEIKEFIRRGDTYQTNLTQQFTAELPENLSPQEIFYNLRKNHPAPFASFMQRTDSTIISASPERFFQIKSELTKPNSQIRTSPIKGTRPRGKTAEEDEALKNELLNSEKDRAENVMIVDLLRNDLGRICEFGSVRVEKLCDLEQHPTLFHLVSTVSGTLRAHLKFSDIIRAVFPCGSITGAPKIRTMQIIEQLEIANRGLSMGAIGFGGRLKTGSDHRTLTADRYFDLSVAIRTMTIRNGTAVFNVGGGIVIDSVPENEYEETLTKAKALFSALNVFFE